MIQISENVPDIFESDFFHILANEERLEREELFSGIFFPESMQDSFFGTDNELFLIGFADKFQDSTGAECAVGGFDDFWSAFRVYENKSSGMFFPCGFNHFGCDFIMNRTASGPEFHGSTEFFVHIGTEIAIREKHDVFFQGEWMQ